MTTTALELLRRDVAALLSTAGVKSDRAARLADLLLWFDAAGLTDLGVASLPDLLDRVARGEVDPRAEPVVGPERAATAVLDGRGGPPLLVLARAAEIASEKAREYGAGLVRVRGIGPVRSAASAVFEVAIGPSAGMAVGPGGAWSLAIPSADGLPWIADGALGSASSVLGAWLPMLGEAEWLIQAVSIPATEPLASLHERMAAAGSTAPETVLSPSRLEEARRRAREDGVKFSDATRAALKSWGERLGV